MVPSDRKLRYGNSEIRKDRIYNGVKKKKKRESLRSNAKHARGQAYSTSKVNNSRTPRWLGRGRRRKRGFVLVEFIEI